MSIRNLNRMSHSSLPAKHPKTSHKLDLRTEDGMKIFCENAEKLNQKTLSEAKRIMESVWDIPEAKTSVISTESSDKKEFDRQRFIDRWNKQIECLDSSSPKEIRDKYFKKDPDDYGCLIIDFDYAPYMRDFANDLVIDVHVADLVPDLFKKYAENPFISRESIYEVLSILYFKMTWAHHALSQMLTIAMYACLTEPYIEETTAINIYALETPDIQIDVTNFNFGYIHLSRCRKAATIAMVMNLFGRLGPNNRKLYDILVIWFRMAYNNPPAFKAFCQNLFDWIDKEEFLHQLKTRYSLVFYPRDENGIWLEFENAKYMFDYFANDGSWIYPKKGIE